MKLDMSQPWMKNTVIKTRILQANRPFHNPVMEAYRQEYLSLSLVPSEGVDRPARRDPMEANRGM